MASLHERAGRFDSNPAKQTAPFTCNVIALGRLHSTFLQLLKSALLAQTTLCSVNFCGIVLRKHWTRSLDSTLSEDFRKRNASLIVLKTVNNGKIVAIALAPLQGKSLRPMTR